MPLHLDPELRARAMAVFDELFARALQELWSGPVHVGSGPGVQLNGTRIIPGSEVQLHNYAVRPL